MWRSSRSADTRRLVVLIGIGLLWIGVSKWDTALLRLGTACIVGAVLLEALSDGFTRAGKHLAHTARGIWITCQIMWFLSRWTAANIGPLTVAAIFGLAWFHFGTIFAAMGACTVAALLVTAAWLALESARHPGLRLGAILSGVSRRRKIRRLWTGAAVAANLHSRPPDSRPMPLSDMRIIHNGLTAVAIPGRVGLPPSVVYDKTDTLASALFCDRVYVTKPHGASGLPVASSLILTFQWGQHLKPLRAWEVPAPTRAGLFVVGVRDDGGPAQLVANQSIMFGGATGSGKSNAAWAGILGLRAAGIPFRLRIIDPQGTEFVLLHERLQHGGIVHDYIGLEALDPTKLKAFFAHTDRAVEARLADMAAKGLRQHIWSDAEPLDVTICDETLLLAKVLKAEGTNHPAMKIAYGGRKANFTMWYLTQMGQKETLGELRSVIPQRVCFRTTSRVETEVVLREGAERDGAPCSLLDLEYDKGVGYAMQPDVRGFRGLRTPEITGADAAVIAAGGMPVDPLLQAIELEQQPHAVYAYFGGGTVQPGVESVIYVGMANDPDRRDAEHRREDDWYKYVTRMDILAWWPTRTEAHEYEVQMIGRMAPLFNKNHNQPGVRPVPAPRVPRPRIFTARRGAGYRAAAIEPPEELVDEVVEE